MPTNYLVKKSKKAKYLQLRISPKEGLLVIVPEKLFISNQEIERFLFEKKTWINKHQKLLDNQPTNNEPIKLPEKVFFNVLDETWQIYYCATPKKRVELSSFPSYKIVLTGGIYDTNHCLKLLKSWIKQKAHQFLEQRLTKLATDAQFVFSGCNVRDMTTRWGSCSSERKINLSTNLIFLPAHLIDHILLHELCHTKYMSHGKRFWGLLQKLDPSCKKNVLELKAAAQFIPSWA